LAGKENYRQQSSRNNSKAPERINQRYINRVDSLKQIIAHNAGLTQRAELISPEELLMIILTSVQVVCIFPVTVVSTGVV
jgi:hypothetical protein